MKDAERGEGSCDDYLEDEQGCREPKPGVSSEAG